MSSITQCLEFFAFVSLQRKQNFPSAPIFCAQKMIWDFVSKSFFFETKIFLTFRFGQTPASLTDSENHKDVSDRKGSVIKFVFR